MPLLKEEIKEVKADRTCRALHAPDYFIHDKSQLEKIESQGIPNYESKLSCYMLLSSFSFFEDYVISAIEEIINFHGGKDHFANLARRRVESFMLPPTEEVKNHKRKLQEPIKGSKHAKYAKHSKALLDLSYRFPTELFSAYGVQCLIQKTNDLKAAEIPRVLCNCFGMKLDQKELEPFHNIREKRNQIAHGTKVRLSLREAIKLNSYLHAFALKIDQHLIEYFYVIENFA